MRFPEKMAGSALQAELVSIIQKDVKDCYQCMKCSSGCPFVAEMDYKPHQLMQLAKLGLFDHVLKSRSLWICASCLTCSSRCPRDIEPATVIEGFRAMVLREKGEDKVQVFHKVGMPRQALIASMRKYRR
ncbi:MAG: 4Fe-4S dicluster domain-containing protein [Bacillota bacterium]|nr:4Fe-4S dicluster domain-containing protein [Bacillota bacterium]